MTVALGEPVYTAGNPPCTGLGLMWSGGELDAAFKGSVAAVLFDDAGKADIEEILLEVVETEFEQDGLRGVLADRERIEDWRVGEAIAETWLTDHRDCHFPWPDGRDERKRGSSLPGADLVGFHADAQDDCPAFGEVETSSAATYPPEAMHGRTGLKRQLEDLRDSAVIRDDLFRYLGHRARRASWLERFQRAGKRYLADKADVRIFGFLVRDVPPHNDDVRARVENLGKNCPAVTRIELLATYLPAGRLDGIGNAVVASRAGGAP